MKQAIMLHSNGEWLLLNDGNAVHCPAYPILKQPTLVVTDFNHAASGMVALEGSPTHASPLIEKRLRSEGLIDQETKILLHHIKRVGSGYQALYTAVAVDEWQRLFSWSENQADHCMLFPLTALLWSRLRPGEARVYLGGKQLMFLANLKHRMMYAGVVVLGQADADIEAAVSALAERVRDLLARDNDDDLALSAQWMPARVRQADDAGRLARQFADITGIDVPYQAPAAFLQEDGATIYSALPTLVASAPLGLSVSSGKARWMLGAEKYLTWASVASLGLSVALVSQATSWTLTANQTRAQTQAEVTRKQPVDERIRSMQQARQMPEGFGVEQEFLGRMIAVAHLPDPVRILRVLNESSTYGIRLLRIHLATPTARSNEPRDAVRPKILTIDGVVDNIGNLQPGALLARFVGSLRNAGYRAAPVEPTQSGSAAQLPVGYFSYQLLPIVEKEIISGQVSNP